MKVKRGESSFVERPTKREFRRLRTALHALPELAATIAFIVALWLLHRELGQYRLEDLKHALASMPHARIAGAVLFTATSYVALTLYDVLAVKYIGSRQPLHRVAFAAFEGFALSQSIALGGLTGASVRYRLYSGWGLAAAEVAAIVVFSAISFWLGFLNWWCGGGLQPTTIRVRTGACMAGLTGASGGAMTSEMKTLATRMRMKAVISMRLAANQRRLPMIRYLTIGLISSMAFLGGANAAQPTTPNAGQPPAQAKPSEAKPDGKSESWSRRWHRPNCAMVLMQSHLMQLKQRLNLSDPQVKDLEAVRIPVLTAAVGLRGQMETYHLQLDEALSTDKPDEAKVLDMERKLRDLYGRIEEDGTKAYIKILGLLTPDQRTTLRQHCSAMGPPGMMMRPWGGRPR